ncbi:MAG: hypothetical protein NTY64_22360, partial [Deltaproteobacteria bacterium]|nr:hypothetical protein [Deltaproteobacteria bacterium]
MLVPMGRGTAFLSSAHAERIVFQTGWENRRERGYGDTLQYPAHNVAGYFNSNNPPPECSPRYRENV